MFAFDWYYPGGGERAWVVADHETPPCLQDAALAGLIDLGD